MDACAKLVSTPFLVRRASQLLSPSLSAAVLKPPETPTDESLAAWQPHPELPNQGHFKGHGHSSQVHWGWGCHGRDSRLWGWNGHCVWEFIIGDARNPSLKLQLFSCTILGFALLEAMAPSCLMVEFLLLFAMGRSHVHFP
ncbi:hypothetical protein GH733_017553 [Mirounga leonina]|nr:hypothetical protein GH733_017553 [Mirounga leonina]